MEAKKLLFIPSIIVLLISIPMIGGTRSPGSWIRVADQRTWTMRATGLLLFALAFLMILGTSMLIEMLDNRESAKEGMREFKSPQEMRKFLQRYRTKKR